jgi:phage-related holin
MQQYLDYFADAKIGIVIMLSGIMTILGQWVYPLLPDASIVAVVFALVGIDTIFGVWLAIQRKAVDSRKYGKVIGKMVVYTLLLAASQQVSTHQVNGVDNYTLTWVNHVIYSLILSRELLSIFEKTHLLGYFTLPKWLEEKFKAFDEKGVIDKGKRDSDKLQ